MLKKSFDKKKKSASTANLYYNKNDHTIDRSELKLDLNVFHSKPSIGILSPKVSEFDLKNYKMTSPKSKLFKKAFK